MPWWECMVRMNWLTESYCIIWSGFQSHLTHWSDQTLHSIRFDAPHIPGHGCFPALQLLLFSPHWCFNIRFLVQKILRIRVHWSEDTTEEQNACSGFATSVGIKHLSFATSKKLGLTVWHEQVGCQCSLGRPSGVNRCSRSTWLYTLVSGRVNLLVSVSKMQGWKWKWVSKRE